MAFTQITLVLLATVTYSLPILKREIIFWPRKKKRKMVGVELHFFRV